MADGVIRTERLILRTFCEADADAYAAINADAAVNEFLPGPLSRDESDALLKRNVDHRETHGFGLFAIDLRETGAFIGLAGLKHPAFEAPFMPAVEIGWRLGSAHWGRGYATEAARAALAHAVDILRLDPIVSFTVPANARSRRVMEKIGFAHDPAGDFNHPRVPPGHPLRRHVLYRYRP